MAGFPAGLFWLNNVSTGDAQKALDVMVVSSRMLVGGAFAQAVAISQDALTPTSGIVRVMTEGGASAGNLRFINNTTTWDGAVIELVRAWSSQSVTIRHGTGAGAIKTAYGTDIAMKMGVVYRFHRRGDAWFELAATDRNATLVANTTFYFSTNGSLYNTGLSASEAWPATQAGINKLVDVNAGTATVTLDCTGTTFLETITLRNIVSGNMVVNGGNFGSLLLYDGINNITLNTVTAESINDYSASSVFNNVSVTQTGNYGITKWLGRGVFGGVSSFAGSGRAAIYVPYGPVQLNIVGGVNFANAVYSRAAVYGTSGVVHTTASAAFSGSFTGKAYQLENDATHTFASAAVHLDNLPGTVAGTISRAYSTTAAFSGNAAVNVTSAGASVGIYTFGNILSTSRVSAGVYEVRLRNAYASLPLASPPAFDGRHWVTRDGTNKIFTVRFVNAAGTPTDSAFTFYLP